MLVQWGQINIIKLSKGKQFVLQRKYYMRKAHDMSSGQRIITFDDIDDDAKCISGYSLTSSSVYDPNVRFPGILQ